MNLEDKLIGSQLVGVSEDVIKVMKDGVVYNLELESYQGECCGSVEFDIIFFDEEDIKYNPVITNVIHKREGDYWSENCELTFFGLNKEILNITAEATSGSGHMYGANVTIYCKSLDINEEIVSY